MTTTAIDYASERRAFKVRSMSAALVVRWLNLPPDQRITEDVESVLLGWNRTRRLALAKEAGCAGKDRDRVPSDETWARVCEVFGAYVAGKMARMEG